MESKSVNIYLELKYIQKYIELPINDVMYPLHK